MENGLYVHLSPGELVFSDVKLPKANVFPDIRGLSIFFISVQKVDTASHRDVLVPTLDCYDSAEMILQERIGLASH